MKVYYIVYQKKSLFTIKISFFNRFVHYFFLIFFCILSFAMYQNRPKVVVLCGPTGSGKTNFSLLLAKKFFGSVISADSRQLYRGMTIGTAKPVGKWRWKWWRCVYEVDGVEHYNLDWLSPKKTFSAAEFKTNAQTWITSIQKKKKVPFIVGGTGLYIDAVVDNLSFPKVLADQALRDELSQKSLEQLLVQLDEIDPEAGAMIDRHNPRRVIRALEVSLLSGTPFSAQRSKGEKQYDVLYLGVSVSKEELDQRLDARIDTMIEQGLVEEVKRLIKKYPFTLPSMSGIGYREFQGFVNGTETIEQAITTLKADTRQYAKRQMTWFKRRKDVVWCETYEEMERAVADFLKK
jgi:tRNA dimethylallyltransferase